MSFAESKIFITPERDTANSHPHDIEFTVNCEGKIMLEIEGRCITFNYSDFKKIISISSVVIGSNL